MTMYHKRQKADGGRQKSLLPSVGKLFAFCLLPSAFFCGLLSSALLLAQDGAQEADSDPQAAADLELISSLERVVSRAIARAERSVVSIARRKRESPQAMAGDSHPGAFTMGGRDLTTPLDPNFAASEFASGVVIDPRGLILTNRHVLGDDPSENDFYVTTADRKVFTAKVSERKVIPMKVKASDGMSDLAVLEPLHEDSVRNGDFTPITFGDAATLHKGQIVIALGNPYGIARDGQASASWGIVSNLARKANSGGDDDDGPKTLHDYGTLIQTDAKLNLGTSGGALVNVRGEMVGLTTSLAATSGFEQPAGYAIPIDKPMLRIIRMLREGREVEYGLLGIKFENRAREEMKQETPGVRVGGVVPGGPADKASLRAQDIITRVDGQTIYDEDGLRLHVSKLPPGSVATLTVLRSADGTPVQRRVVLRKMRVEVPQTYTNRPPAWRGAIVDWRVPRRQVVGPFIAVPDEDFTTPCVAVREVEEGSLAWQAGLRAGQLVSHVGSASVGTPEEFSKAVASQTGPVKLRLCSPDDGGQQSLIIPAE